MAAITVAVRSADLPHRAFRPLRVDGELKPLSAAKRGQRIAVYSPARDEASTIGSVVATLDARAATDRRERASTSTTSWPRSWAASTRSLGTGDHL
jgi:hypothetical protein